MLLPMKAVTFHWGRAVTAIAITQPVTAQVKLISCIPVFTISPPSEYHASSGHNLDDTFPLAGGPTIDKGFGPPCPQRSARLPILGKKSRARTVKKKAKRGNPCAVDPRGPPHAERKCICGGATRAVPQHWRAQKSRDGAPRTERKAEEVGLSSPVIEESTSFGLELAKTDIRTPSDPEIRYWRIF
ncbi:hypothetical protein Q8A67_015100 [Cirrhinus molitorella]|uniref:Uncharacterized protein n=1 Tax=Cirrhinus molitorella TaxID=172907 RepID=A0AA88PH31_9TELE|nr:hypothetical protein Q8A67_015100 [Cirrhinus molitorella]